MEGDTLQVNKLPNLDIEDQVVFGDISLIGTDQYTVIGRPSIGNAKVSPNPVSEPGFDLNLDLRHCPRANKVQENDCLQNEEEKGLQEHLWTCSRVQHS